MCVVKGSPLFIYIHSFVNCLIVNSYFSPELIYFMQKLGHSLVPASTFLAKVVTATSADKCFRISSVTTEKTSKNIFILSIPRLLRLLLQQPLDLVRVRIDFIFILFYFARFYFFFFFLLRHHSPPFSNSHNLTYTIFY